MLWLEIVGAIVLYLIGAGRTSRRNDERTKDRRSR